MWFDIFKIQVGSHTTLVPKNMPKIREDEPCKDRLKRIIDEMMRHNNFGPKIINNSNSHRELNEIHSLFSHLDKRKTYSLLPLPIELRFDNSAMAIITSGIGEIPEHICCEFLKYLEVLKTDYQSTHQYFKETEKDYQLSDDWNVSTRIHGQGVDVSISGSKFDENNLTILLNNGDRVIIEMSSTFWLRIAKQELTQEQKNTMLRIQGDDYNDLYEQWINSRFDSKYLFNYASKEDIRDWFYHELDLFWWFE